MLGHTKIVEQRILEAMEKGEFDNLPGHGKPLRIEDDRHIPEDLRLAYKILKNADCLPPEVESVREIRQMEDMLETLPDEKERYKLIKKINYRIMKLNVMGASPPFWRKNSFTTGSWLTDQAARLTSLSEAQGEYAYGHEEGLL